MEGKELVATTTKYNKLNKNFFLYFHPLLTHLIFQRKMSSLEAILRCFEQNNMKPKSSNMTSNKVTDVQLFRQIFERLLRSKATKSLNSSVHIFVGTVYWDKILPHNFTYVDMRLVYCMTTYQHAKNEQTEM